MKLVHFFFGCEAKVEITMDGKDSYNRNVVIPPFVMSPIKKIAEEGKKRGAHEFQFFGDSFICKLPDGRKVKQKILSLTSSDSL